MTSERQSTGSSPDQSDTRSHALSLKFAEVIRVGSLSSQVKGPGLTSMAGRSPDQPSYEWW